MRIWARNLSLVNRRSLITLVGACSLAACGPKDSGPGEGDLHPPEYYVDDDRDGFSEDQGDCNDAAPAVNPNGTETCNGIDDDCSGHTDDQWDHDLDQHATCGRDCDDNDPTRYVGAVEELDGVDNDCDGIIDNHREDYDDDGDGYTELEGDCADMEALINPGAIEVMVREDGTPEGVDNDCDGLTDLPRLPCDTGLMSGTAWDLVKAMDLCQPHVRNATLNTDADVQAYEVVPGFGTYMPRGGGAMASMASGSAGPAPVSTQVSFLAQTAHGHPAPAPNPMDGCGMADAAEVYDYTELLLDIDVPMNAKSFSFDFNFMSAEYPEWVCKQYDDTFLVMLESQSFTGNISFDEKGKPVTVNVGFFDVCAVGSEPPGKPANTCTGNAELLGSGFDNGIGGGTGWLTTTAPVTPGEKIKLRFIIFDEGDHAYDSGVLIDNFRWLGTPVDAPSTEG